MSRNEDSGITQNEGSRQNRAGYKDFTAPLGSASAGLLVFPAGASELTLLEDPGLPGLARCRWTPQISWAGIEKGIIVVGYHPALETGLLETGSEITLNASLPWVIRFCGDAVRVTARFGTLPIKSLTISGEANQIILQLSRPAGTAHLYLGGGTEVSIRRPPDVPIGVNVYQSAARLRLDRQQFSAVESDTRLESAGFRQAFYRYEINLTGPTSRMTIQ